MIKKGDVLTKISNYEAGLVRQYGRTIAHLNDVIDQWKDIQQRLAAQGADEAVVFDPSADEARPR
ncbi:MAG: hypothetical protein ACOYLQ_19520 [Hyphomicrobiaceae bacterium]